MHVFAGCPSHKLLSSVQFGGHMPMCKLPRMGQPYSLTSELQPDPRVFVGIHVFFWGFESVPALAS